MKIEEIMAIARKTMLKNGRCDPTLFLQDVQGNQRLALLCDYPDTTEQKQRFLFASGRYTALAIAPEQRQLAQICMATQAWLGSYSSVDEVRKYQRASDDPNRKDVLMVQMMDVSDGSMTMCCEEILRSGAGVDLLPHIKPTPCHSTLLAAFYAGYTSAAMDDEELAEFMAALQSTTVERLGEP